MKGQQRVGNISTNDIQSLIQLFEKSDWREMHLILGETDLFLSKDRNAQTQISLTTATPSVPALSHRASVPATPVETPDPKPHGSRIPAGWTLVKAPSLGTFYRAPKPSAPMFTEIGAQVAADSELCLIEVMKLFTTLRAGTHGTIREIYAKDGELVEFDQPLFLIEPDA